MNKKAYLNVKITPVEGAIPSAVISQIQIHSSPSTQITCGLWSNVLTVEANSFQDACDKVMWIVTNSPLKWMLPWLLDSQEACMARNLLKGRVK